MAVAPRLNQKQSACQLGDCQATQSTRHDWRREARLEFDRRALGKPHRARSARRLHPLRVSPSIGESTDRAGSLGDGDYIGNGRPFE
jgi:hypothetical protein